jgi:hypothetical protein
MGESPMAFFILDCRMQIEDFLEMSENDKLKEEICNLKSKTQNPKGGGGHGAGSYG